MSIDQPPQHSEQEAAAEEFRKAYAARFPHLDDEKVQDVYENSGIKGLVAAEDEPSGVLDILSHRARIERAHKIGREVGRSMHAERELVPELLLEVGTVNVDGRSYPGFNLAELNPGTTIYTVDLLQKFQGGYQSRGDTPTDMQVLKSFYADEAGWLEKQGKDIPDFSHIPVIGDGRELPFGDNTFDKVLFNDVIGDPAVKSWNIEKLIQEALRVVRVGGEVWVVDDRGVGSNFTAFEEMFPNGEKKPYLRSEDLRFWHYDLLGGEISSDEFNRLQQEYDTLASKVIASDPEFYVIKKLADTYPKSQDASTGVEEESAALPASRRFINHLRRKDRLED